MKLSIVVPVFNEAAGLSLFIEQLQPVIRPYDYELLFVNDGSTDATLDILRRYAETDPRLSVISLSRNFGKEIALSAGLDQARGEAILTLDADGQHPVELIPEFVAKWQAGSQVVVGIRRSNRHEGFIKHFGSRGFYKLFNKISGLVLLPGVSDFRLIDKTVQAEFRRFNEPGRLTRGLIDWLGFDRTTINFDARPRLAGRSPYRPSKLIRLAINSFVAHSTAPLYAIGYTGLAVTLLSTIAGAFVLVEQTILHDPLGLKITGTARIGLLTIFLVGILLMAQGLMAVYLSHIHAQSQNRPLFIIDEHKSIGRHSHRPLS